MNTELIISAVIELAPSDFAKQEYHSPNGSRFEYPKEWNEYWQKSLADAELINVQEIIDGLGMIDITTIELTELMIILKNHLQDVDTNNVDEIHPLEGGIVIQQEEKSIVPQCCVSLSDYKAWEAFLEEKPQEWSEIWIGHPWIYARIVQGQIEISEYCEYNPPTGHPVWRVNLKKFEEVFEKVIFKIKQFKQVVAEVLHQIGVVNSHLVAQILIENEE